MIRNLGCALTLATFSFLGTAHAQQLDTSMSDKQIITNILKDCHELYAHSVGDCACAPDRTKEGTRCHKALKDLPESFKPFCTRKDVTLRVHPEVGKALKAQNGKLIGEMEELIGKTVIVKSDPLLHQENFDIH